MILHSETFVLITVIDRLVQITTRVVHFLLHFIRQRNNHSGSGSRRISFFFFLYNLVSFVRTDMCDTSMKSCVHGLYFVFLHLRALSNLRGCYDPKIEKKNLFFFFVTVISSHRIKCNISVESSQQYLHFILHRQALSNLRGRYDPKSEKGIICPCNCVIPSHRIKCDTCNESCHQWLYFTFLH